MKKINGGKPKVNLRTKNEEFDTWFDFIKTFYSEDDDVIMEEFSCQGVAYATAGEIHKLNIKWFLNCMNQGMTKEEIVEQLPVADLYSEEALFILTEEKKHE